MIFRAHEVILLVIFIGIISIYSQGRIQEMETEENSFESVHFYDEMSVIMLIRFVSTVTSFSNVVWWECLITRYIILTSVSALDT